MKNYSLRAPGTLSHRDRSHLSTTPWGSDSNSPAGSGRASPFSGQPAGHRYADDLEGQNDEALAGLTAKVKLLKDVSCRCFIKVAYIHFLPRSL